MYMNVIWRHRAWLEKLFNATAVFFNLKMHQKLFGGRCSARPLTRWESCIQRSPRPLAGF